MKTIEKIFLKNKIIPLDSYLDKVLYDKNFGYYQKKNPFGINGDYITAPNISNIFCEMISIWLVGFWENLGRPKNFNFVEMGPGNGDFCIILLKTLKKFPYIFNSINIMLYERSKKLKNLQKKRIVSGKVSWIQDFKRIKKGPVIFFGNEFLDALPIKQFKKEGNNIFEKYVALKNNSVSFVYKKIKKKQLLKLENFNLLNSDGVIEYPEHGFKELDEICKKIRKLNGGALFIDYGYKSGKKLDTLQSIIKHNYNDIDKNLGKADITSLVNFGLYEKYFYLNGLNVEDVITQSKFLQKMGILERFKIAVSKMSTKSKTDLYLRIKRLIDPKFMGENFKVIFAKNRSCDYSLAFK